MRNAFQRVQLGELLTRSDEMVEIATDKLYQQVTVRLWGKGVLLRDVVSGAEIAADRRYVVRAQQFILSKIDARNGAFGLVPDSLDGAIVSSDFPVFKLNCSRILPKFLDWMSKTNDFIDLCKAASEGTTNRIRLRNDQFLATQISLPPLEEQQRIVARIEELAARIEEAKGLRRKAETEAESLTNAVMRRIFSLKDYQIVPLESICNSIIDNLHSNPIYSDSGVPCIRAQDVGWGKLNLVSALKTSEEEYIRRTVRGEPLIDDIVLVREGTVGKAAIVEEGQRFSLGQRVMMLRPNKQVVMPKFFLYQLLSPVIYEDQILASCNGSTSSHLNISKLRKFTFLLPILSEQRRIVDYLDHLHTGFDILKHFQSETSVELGALLPSVLNKAFKGEL